LLQGGAAFAFRHVFDPEMNFTEGDYDGEKGFRVGGLEPALDS